MGARARRPARGGAQVTRRRREARRALLAWYRAARRDLPWRRTRDPYAIWVSETMLQQTRVEAVIPYYERFLARFPDVGALAGADLDDVLSLWAGLGYYSRARNLKRAAEQVVTRIAGRLPDDADALRELPGIGRYTAGAIASIAFDRPAPIVDGNVARVLARLLGICASRSRSSAVKARLWEEAERLADGPAPGDLNQALMELGARVCIPRAPRCDAVSGVALLRRARRGRRRVAAGARAEARAEARARRRGAGRCAAARRSRCNAPRRDCSADSGSCPAARHRRAAAAPRRSRRCCARARGSTSKRIERSATSSTSSRIGRCTCACSLAPQRLAACASTAGIATAGSHPATSTRCRAVT